VDVAKLLPKSLPSGKKILWKEVDKERIEISVDKNSARGGNAKPIVIRRFVPINELLFEGLGLRFGDGNRIQGGKFNVFGYSNTEIEQLKYFIKFSEECFDVKSNKFNVKISINPNSEPQLEDIRNKVSKELDIPLENFWKPQIFDKRKIPFVDIKIQSVILGFVIKLVYEITRNLMFSSDLFSAYFLRGVIAGEANVYVRKEGRLSDVFIACEGETKRGFLRNLLSMIGIIPNKDKTKENQEGVLINGLSNFRIMKKWNLTKLSPNKSKDFERGMKGFVKEEFRKGECKFLVLRILLDSKKSVKEIAKFLRRKPRTINDAVAFLERKNLIKRVRSRRNIFWEITENGSLFLKNNGTSKDLRNNN